MLHRALQIRPGLRLAGGMEQLSVVDPRAVQELLQDAPAALPEGVLRYVGEFGAEWGHFAAGAILVSLPVTVLFFVLQKQLVEGLTAGGVKG